MREYSTGITVANTVRLTRDSHKGAFLLVEEDTDARLYKRFVNIEACRVIVAHNKENAIGALLELEKQGGIEGVLAIVDADFDILEGTAVSQGLLYTDAHDLESMIMQSPALEKVLDEFGSEEKIRTFLGQYQKDIRTVLLDAGVVIGYLRLLSLQASLNFNFNNLNFDGFIDRVSLIIDQGQLIRVVRSRSHSPDASKLLGAVRTDEDVRVLLNDLMGSSYDSWHMCNGHDLSYILLIGLRRALGNSQKLDVQMLETALRLAYEQAHFRSTKLYALIREWEIAHSPFMILLSE